MVETVALRPVQPADLPVFFEQGRDPVARRMAAFVSADPDDWTAFESKWASILTDGKVLARTVTVDGVTAGNLGHFEQFGRPSISYWLGRQFWGRGIATRAVGAFVSSIAVRPLYARAAKDNMGSLRVLGHCGFIPIAEERGYSDIRAAEVDEVIFELSGAAD